MENNQSYLDQQVDEIRQTVGRDLLITEEAAIREQLISDAQAVESLSEEDQGMVVRLEIMYPSLLGKITTKEDLTRVLMDLRGEDD